jgi:hypothetical protein
MQSRCNLGVVKDDMLKLLNAPDHLRSVQVSSDDSS